MIAAAATVALSAAALAPTAASAGGHGGHHGHHGHHGHWGGGYSFGLYNTYDVGGCYIVKKVVNTEFGPALRRVTVCN